MKTSINYSIKWLYLICIVVIIFAQCTPKTQNANSNPDSTELPSDSTHVDYYNLMTCVSESGDSLCYELRVATIRPNDDDEVHYAHLYYVTNLTKDTSYAIPFEYDRYNNGTNWYWRCTNNKPYYIVSPDQKSFYSVTRVFASSDGWTTEYQLYRVDFATIQPQFIGDFAAMMVVEDGIICAVARLTNEETATCTADEEWVMHDILINWKGKIIQISKNEYDYATMERRFETSEYTLLKGFNVKPDTLARL